jgi:hypothetical protein
MLFAMYIIISFLGFLLMGEFTVTPAQSSCNEALAFPVVLSVLVRLQLWPPRVYSNNKY